jgi:hypothetical protein
MRSILKNTRIVTPNGDFNGYVVIENGMIVDIQKDKTLSEGQDLRGRWLSQDASIFTRTIGKVKFAPGQVQIFHWIWLSTLWTNAPPPAD